MSSSTTTNCPLCGATIVWALAEDGPIALDSAEALTGPHRYIMEDPSQAGEPWKVIRVAPAAMIPAYIDHGKICSRRVRG